MLIEYMMYLRKKIENLQIQLAEALAEKNLYARLLQQEPEEPEPEPEPEPVKSYFAWFSSTYTSNQSGT